MITINEARKKLGKSAIGVSDEVLIADMETAEMLKNIFFNVYVDDLNKNKLKSINHGKKCCNLH